MSASEHEWPPTLVVLGETLVREASPPDPPTVVVSSSRWDGPTLRLIAYLQQAPPPQRLGVLTLHYSLARRRPWPRLRVWEARRAARDLAPNHPLTFARGRYGVVHFSLATRFTFAPTPPPLETC